MRKYNVLVLTDHVNHSIENSLYALSRAMQNHKQTNRVDILSRGNKDNSAFFNQDQNAEIFVKAVDENFEFTLDNSGISSHLRKVNPRVYDLIWLRMPPPLSKTFLDYCKNFFKGKMIINNPDAIHITGSKEFLINFKSICPPIKLCKSIEDIITFKRKFPIVLKPFRAYGGKGIVRIDDDKVWVENEVIAFDQFINEIEASDIAYLGVKYLKNVSKGDKRIVVVNGKILGASLRLPPKDSWICNVAMGGRAMITEVDEDEVQIVQTINPILSEMGIVMYGVDTLVDDNGKRVLSEINTTSIGGLPQIAALKNQPLVEEAINLIWDYYLKNVKNA